MSTTAKIGGVEFKLYPSKNKTVEEACFRAREDLLAAYRDLTEDEREVEEIDLTAAVKVVRLHVERAWHETIRGADPSVQFLDELRNATVEALTADGREDPASGQVYRTQKDVVRDGLKADLSTSDILDMIYEFFPDSKATRKSVAQYKWLLKQDGEIDV